MAGKGTHQNLEYNIMDCLQRNAPIATKLKEKIIPFSEVDDPTVRSPSNSYEVFPGTSDLEYVGDMHPVSRNWSQLSGCSSDSKFYVELQEQYKFTIERCFTELKTIKRKEETTFIQMKKIIRDKVETMLKIVRQSFEYMHIEGTKHLELKCEEIGRVLGRVEKMLEEVNLDISLGLTAYNRENVINNKTFLNEALKEKERIELEVEALIQQLNKKRESDEQIYVEFREDVQQKVQGGISRIERSLESQAEDRTRAVEDKITELRRTLANLQHLSKFS